MGVAIKSSKLLQIVRKFGLIKIANRERGTASSLTSLSAAGRGGIATNSFAASFRLDSWCSVYGELQQSAHGEYSAAQVEV
jgi:hypothetical protein